MLFYFGTRKHRSHHKCHLYHSSVSSTVKGESAKDRKLRALHVMSMLRGYGQPELWGHVSQHFVKKGKLDLSELLSNTNLPDLVYLLQSGAASDVTRLV